MGIDPNRLWLKDGSAPAGTSSAPDGEGLRTPRWLAVSTAVVALASGGFFYGKGLERAHDMQHSLKSGKNTAALNQRRDALGNGFTGVALIGLGLYLPSLASRRRKE